MSDKLAVVGAGTCGAAAAWALAQRGFKVDCFFDGVGETEQSSGAWDFQPWTEATTRSPDVSHPVWQFIRELDAFDVEPDSASSTLLVSSLGVLRSAAGAWRGILRVPHFVGATIGVLDVGRRDFDAHWIARALSEQEWSRQTSTRFSPIKLGSVFNEAEARLPLASFCRLLDDESRLKRALAEVDHLRQKYPSIAALVSGPWLGTSWSVDGASRCLASHQLPWFETLHDPDGPLGQRWRGALDQLFNKFDVQKHQARVHDVRVEGERIRLDLGEGSLSDEYRGAVLCTGGLLGGGKHGRRVQHGANHGWEWDDAEQGVSGMLAGWDPTIRPRSWLYSSLNDIRVTSSGAVTRVQVPLAGAGTHGQAALLGIEAAEELLKTLA